ncbi:DUF4105 domain-containing protein [Sinimarinibacterium thermocellulolyticum]|uniref:DUF4105 domain-containing protein n=1 Tax=Sinimarinibacterium thermocellulolyticum TaxID=3170016 RepID=A0ABV2A6B8_9GAMM
MRIVLRFAGVLLIFASAVTAAVAATPAAPQISLLTFAPGQIYWQRFGHNALLVREAGAAPQVYNYGIFDFGQKHFFLNFVRGRMLYRLDVAPLDWTLRQYAAEGRWVIEQPLALDAARARALADHLAWNARPENAHYRYDYFLANCSTRVRDVLDQALDGALRRQLAARPASGTYRSEVLRLMAPMPALMAGMDLGLGPRVDVPLDQWDEGFIPERLMQALRQVRIDDAEGIGRALIAGERTLVAANAVDRGAPPRLDLPFLLVGLALAAVLVLLARHRAQAVARAGFAALAMVYALVAGLGGAVLLLGWLATDHWGMARNHNLLLLHPLWWLLLPALVRHAGQRPARRSACTRTVTWLTAAAGVAALPLALFGAQPNLHWVALLLPPGLALLYGLQRRP